MHLDAQHPTGPTGSATSPGWHRTRRLCGGATLVLYLGTGLLGAVVTDLRELLTLAPLLG